MRTFMTSSKRTGDDRWKLTEPSEGRLFDEEEEERRLVRADKIDKLKAVGLPVPRTHRQCLQQVAYALKCRQASQSATAIRVPPADYKECLTLEEAVFLCHSGPDPHEKVRKYISSNKPVEESWKNVGAALGASKSALKCAMAVGAAREVLDHCNRGFRNSTDGARRPSRTSWIFFRPIPRKRSRVLAPTPVSSPICVTSTHDN